MGQAADGLLAHMADGSAYVPSYVDIRDQQVAAMNERLQEFGDKIKIVALRAADADITEIKTLADVVPLLLPHTAYKSYPESYLTGKKWDRLTKWLGSVTSLPTGGIDLTGVEGIDQWIERMGEAGHLVSCSSGTTGKSAMLTASKGDLDFAAQDGIQAIEWGSKIRRGDKRTMGGSGGAVAHSPRNSVMGGAMVGAFIDLTKPFPASKLPPITVGSLTEMITLRKSIADGTAAPEDIAAFDAESAVRAKAMGDARETAIDEVIANRGDRLYMTGMWGTVFGLAEGIRARGYSAKDFHPENAIYLGGGLKRAQLPDDYREYVYDTFNLSPEYIFQMYGMQEINSSMPRCQEGGRYHVPAWVVAIPLNKEGDALVDFDPNGGEVECRAAFFDLSMEGRWGGVISGDRIHIDFGTCKCGHASPSIRDDIARYADLEGDDKIGCSGTVDAYVRGLS
jgi:hypothetical protein